MYNVKTNRTGGYTGCSLKLALEAFSICIKNNYTVILTETKNGKITMKRSYERIL